ncbi:MAG: type II secretion system F family protein [Rickettsiales bacterium]|jgi:tight adherence protein C|nr:type II secretion system F family protein [Rickettsiales bacterium]
MDYMIYALIVLGVFTGYMALVNLFKRGRPSIAMTDMPQRSDYLNMQESSIPPLASFCQSMVSIFGKNEAKQKEVAVFLSQAGIYSPYAPAYYLFFQRFIQPLFLLLAVVLFYKMLFPAEQLGAMAKIKHMLLVLICAAIGIWGAKLYVTNLKQRRQKIMLRSFPETLDLLLVCIESGLGLDAALARVCNEMRETHPVMISELDRTRAQLTVMSDRSQVLQALADRTDIVQFKSLISALMQTEKFGTSLVDTLRVLSDDLRTTRLMTAENRAARIPVLITIPLIFCVLPAFIMIILGPPIVKVVQQGGIFGEKNQTSR